MSTSKVEWAITSVAQIFMFGLLVWWVAIVKFITSIMTLIFGPRFKQSLLGSKIRNTDFTLSRSITFLNHGSYGTVPKVVQNAQRQLKNQMESCPDGFFSKVEPAWLASISSIAKFVNSHDKNLVFVPNATTGINAVMRSLDLSEGQSILVTNQTYGAVHKTAQEVCSTKNCNLVVLNITFPLSDLDGSAEFYVGDIVDQYRCVLQNNPQIKLAIVDYITSSSAIKLPVKQIIQVCRQHDVTVLIDGAHAPGQVQLDLDSLDADFFIGNLHKWLYCPRGAAILWVHPKFHDIINPLVVSWNQDGHFQEKFLQQGTLDYTSYLVVDSALKFYEDIGGLDAISAHCKPLISWASIMLAVEWRTEVLCVPESMRAPFMACIRLPSEFQTTYGISRKSGILISKHLLEEHHVVTYILSIQSSLWCRISANVYNVKSDYTKLAKAISTMKHQIILGLLKKPPVLGNSLGSSPSLSLNTLN